jgi:tetratricopeptide (TPR) repeat protein
MSRDGASDDGVVPNKKCRSHTRKADFVNRLGKVAVILGMKAGLLLLSFSQAARSEDCAALVNQGKSLLSEQKIQEAQNSFLSATRVCPDLAEAHKFLGITYDQQQRFADAQRAFQKSIALDPNDAGTHNDLAVSYFRSGNADAAAKELESTLRLDPANVSANGNLAAYCLSQKKYQEAADRLLAAHAERSQDPLLLLELTEAYFGSGKHSEAMATAAKLSQVAGPSPQMRFSLGLVLAENGEYPSALNEFSAIPEQARDAAVYGNLANVYAKLGRFPEAQDAFRKAIREDPSNPEPYLQMGLNSLKAGNLEEALDWLGQAHEKGSTRTDVTQALAEALIQAQQFDRARDLLTAAQAQTPRDPLILQAVGDLHSSLHQDQQALQAYQQCLQIDPHRVETHLALARLFGRLNRTSEEKAEYETVLETDPQNPSAHAGLGHLALQSRSLDLADNELRAALSHSPNDLQSNEDLALVRMRQGKYDQARGLYTKLVTLSPNNPGYHFELGQALLKLGRKEEAQREFNRSQELKAAVAKKTG